MFPTCWRLLRRRAYHTVNAFGQKVLYLWVSLSATKDGLGSWDWGRRAEEEEEKREVVEETEEEEEGERKRARVTEVGEFSPVGWKRREPLLMATGKSVNNCHSLNRFSKRIWIITKCSFLRPFFYHRKVCSMFGKMSKDLVTRTHPLLLSAFGPTMPFWAMRSNFDTFMLSLAGGGGMGGSDWCAWKREILFLSTPFHLQRIQFWRQSIFYHFLFFSSSELPVQQFQVPGQ